MKIVAYGVRIKNEQGMRFVHPRRDAAEEYAWGKDAHLYVKTSTGNWYPISHPKVVEVLAKGS